MTSTITLPLDMLILDADIQPRETLSSALIREYAELYRDGDTLPPIAVFQEARPYWVADGFHRVTAAREAGLSEINADLHVGTKRDAIRYSCGANKHGKARTPEDKRRAVGRLIADPEWCTWSDREIARHCGVSHEFVRRLRPSLANVDSEDARRTYRTKHGTIATIDTSRLGRTSGASTTEALEPSTAPSAPEDHIVHHDGPTLLAPVSGLGTMDRDDAREHGAEVLDTEARPHTTIKATLPSTDEPAAQAMAFPMPSKTPPPSHEPSTVLRLMEDLCTALRQQHGTAPATAGQGWSLLSAAAIPPKSGWEHQTPSARRSARSRAVSRSWRPTSPRR